MSDRPTEREIREAVDRLSKLDWGCLSGSIRALIAAAKTDVRVPARETDLAWRWEYDGCTRQSKEKWQTVRMVGRQGDTVLHEEYSRAFIEPSEGAGRMR